MSGEVDAPCLFGLISPAIYVPPEVVSDEKLLRHALAHEVSHYKQHDHIWCVVRCVCLALHWYNPLVWLAVKFSRRDCELACDEATVRRLGEGERADYGRSLIKLTCESPRGAAVATTMSAKPKELRDRIKMLTKRKHSIIALLLAAILAFTATACSFVSSATEPTPIPGSDPGTIALRDDGSDTYDFTAPGGAEGVRLSAWTFDGTRWVEHPQNDVNCSAETGSLSFNVSTVSDTYSYLLEFTGRNSVSVSDKSLGELVGDESADFRGTHFDCGPMECAVNETVPLVLVSTASGASTSYFTNPGEIEDKDAKYVCFTITFTAGEGSILLRGQDETVDPPYQAVYDFTAPEGAGQIQINFYRLNNGAIELCNAMAYPLDTAEGALTIGYEDTISLDVAYSDGTGANIKGISLDDITQTENQGWGVQLQQGREFAIAGDEVPLMMFSSGSIGVNWDAYYNPSNYSGQDVDCVFLAVRFVAGALSAGQIAYDDSAADKVEANFNFTAPAGTAEILVREYSLESGAWSEIRRETFDCTENSGQLAFRLDMASASFGYDVRFDAGEVLDFTSHSVGEYVTMPTGGWLTEPSALYEGEEVPLVMLQSSISSFYATPDMFSSPDELPDSGIVCVTVTFVGASGELTEPEPIRSPSTAVQGAEMVGFTTEYDAQESYADAVSDWVHDYAANLVLGLSADDPASCSGVRLDSYSVLGASMAGQESIVAFVSFICTPRDEEKFIDEFGSFSHYIHPVTQEQGYLISRYIVLDAGESYWTCVSASTDMPDMWGYLSTLPSDSFERFLTGLDGSAEGAKTAVACTNYSELGEISNDSWMVLLDALDSVAIDENGEGDQLIRDLYAMHAAMQSDGAYSEWLGEILLRQREHDEAAFNQALGAFTQPEQEIISALATPLE